MKWEISFVIKGDSTYATIVADAIRTRLRVEDVEICHYLDEKEIRYGLRVVEKRNGNLEWRDDEAERKNRKKGKK